MIIALVIAAFAVAAASPVTSTSVLPNCSASQLAITFDSEDGNFSGMSQSGTLLIVRNIGTDACRMAALPALRFEDAAHHALSIVRQVPIGMHPGPVVLPVGIAPGLEATAVLHWVSGDVYGGHQCVFPTAAIVQVGTGEYRQAFTGRFCSASNMPATFTQTWLKIDTTINSNSTESATAK